MPLDCPYVYAPRGCEWTKPVTCGREAGHEGAHYPADPNPKVEFDLYVSREHPEFPLYALGKILILFGLVKPGQRRLLLHRLLILLEAYGVPK
jgi:hypothetical protein